MVSDSDTGSTIEPDSLTPADLQDAQQIIRAAELLTKCTLIALWVPAVFLYIVVASIVRIIQSRKLRKRSVGLANVSALYPGLARKELKLRAKGDPQLKTLLEFSSAGVAFWITLVVPFAYAAFIIGIVWWYL